MSDAFKIENLDYTLALFSPFLAVIFALILFIVGILGLKKGRKKTGYGTFSLGMVLLGVGAYFIFGPAGKMY